MKSQNSLETKRLRKELRLRKLLAASIEADGLDGYAPYPKQRDFHAGGAKLRERLLMAANQVGKTYCGAAEAAMHLTGIYPKWWKGRRFNRAVRMWAGSKTAEVARDGVQRLLIGPPRDITRWGTGLIPKDRILDHARKSGTANALDGVSIAHASGGTSSLGFKSYDQSREVWQGETLDVVWFDEEPPLDIYMEGLTRTNASKGLVYLTFTPLLGHTDLVEMFVKPGEGAGQGRRQARGLFQMTIDDAAHFDAEQRALVIASYAEHEREARVNGIPVLGSGRVFPIKEEQIVVQPFEIGEHFLQINGMDFGYAHPFAGVNLAYDAGGDILYVVRDYAEARATPLIHAAAVRPWGDWIPWAWPHDGYREDPTSSRQQREIYAEHGLNMLPIHARWPEGGFGMETGITQMLERMETGRFKVFASCSGWLSEFRMYHRKDGRIVKQNDDRMAATRYALMMLREARRKPSPRYVDIEMPNFGVV